MKISRILLSLLGLAILGAVAAPLAGAWWLRSYVNKERLVLETEKNINARVQLDDVVFTLFTWPPTIRLSGLKIAPRDKYAGTPLEGRPQLQHAPVEIDMAYLELDSDGLWRRQFYPRVLRIMGVEVQERLDAQGSSLEKLFQRPVAEINLTEDGVPRAIPLSPPGNEPVNAPPAPGKSTLVQDTTEPVVTAIPQVELPPAEKSRAERLALQEISIEQAHFHIVNQDADSKFNADISDFSLSLTDIDIDPENLMAHNRLHVRLAAKAVVDGMAKIGGQMRQVRFADMVLHGDGEVKPVDPATMAWSPAADLKLVIDRGSSIGGNMTIGETAGQNLDKLMKYGIDISAVRIGGTFLQDVNAHILFHNQYIQFLSDTQFVLPDYEYTIKHESWMDFAKDQQGLLTRLSCGDALKQSIINGIASRGVNKTLSQMAVDLMSDSRGRLSFDLTITGSLAHPEVKPDLQRKLEGLLGNDIEDKAKGLLNGLKGLFKKL
ncbi:hypothetical protein [Prosthecobacter sp.]|uniref:hypothetical protein n=1 Tax=Prosthecobacter sp. TaxID=1965333 RepID=UPI001E1A2FD4|nr:hypothetical protein [Prosthecobacter sp.]MCB1278553.1 hypothetical protein [Prosthecobacter sp.]